MLPPDVRKRIRKCSQPVWIDPMLATLVSEPFSSSDWIFEDKLDGVRCLTFRNRKSLRLLSRNRKALNQAYPELIDALAGQATDSYIVDGEIVAFEGAVTSFSRLQRRMQTSVDVFYYVFDLLYLDGYDLRDVPLIHRKALLRAAFDFRDPLRFTEHRERDGEKYFQQACGKGLEGVIAKRAGSTYVSGRSRDWLKIKCWNEQEFVIVGFTEPKGARVGFGALLLGYYEGDKLRYAGKVGTGFDNHLLSDLAKQLSSLELKHSPLTEEVKAGKGVHWVKPKLIAQVSFTEWTSDGKLRHPRFLGLRRDKDPRSVVREQPHQPRSGTKLRGRRGDQK